VSAHVLHLISDSTGETASAAVNAVLSQFDNPNVDIRLHVLVRNAANLDAALAQVVANPGLVIYTLLDPELKSRLAEACARQNVAAIALLEPLFTAIAGILGLAQKSAPGRQYETDRSYFERVAAIDYAISLDDGASGERLRRADVILIGVSRTSKTPTCIYLACRGVKAANVPLLPDRAAPPALLEAISAGVPVVALTASPARLAQIRTNRLETIGGGDHPDYADLDRIRAEVSEARLLFERLKAPVIDVTRRSIEETAAEILAILRNRRAP
jgi:regulator of PEP synthase PpsR (kinase-PPPase family)